MARRPWPISVLLLAILAFPIAAQTISPASGPDTGGTPFVITGSGFAAPIAIAFGDRGATVTDVTPTTISGITPPHPAGLSDVTIVRFDGTSLIVLAKAFRFTCPQVPAAPAFSAPALVCPSSTARTATITNVQPATTYAWTLRSGDATITSAAEGTSITFDAGTKGPIVFDVTATNICGSTSGTLQVAIDAPAPFPIVGAPTACRNSAGNMLAVAPHPGDQYLWTMQNGTITSDPTAASITYTAGASGLVTVSVKRTNGCGVVSEAATEVAIDAPFFPRIMATLPSGIFLAETDAVCAGESVNAAAPDFGPNTTYAWTIANASNVVTSGPTASFTAGAGAAVDVSLVVTDRCGTTVSVTRSIAVNQAPAIDIHSQSAACPTAANSAYVLPLPNAAYAWQITNGTIVGSSTSPFLLFNSSASGNVTLTLTETRCGLQSTATKVIPVSGAIDVPLAVSLQNACPGAALQAFLQFAGPGETYSWSVTNAQLVSPANGQSITFIAGATEPVTVTASVTRCGTTSSKSITVPIATPPVATITAPPSTCAFSARTASVPAVEGGYQWTIENGTIVSGANERVVTFTAGASGSVTLRVLVGTACGRFATSSVNIPISTIGVLIAGPNLICGSGSVVLDAGPGYASYLWSTGATTRTITVSPAATTQYGVTVTNAGCSSSGSKSVTVDPPASITTEVGTLFATLTASPGVAYLWSNGARTRTIVVSSGEYSVTVTGAGGCVSTSPKASVNVVAPGANVLINSATLSLSLSSVVTGGAVTTTAIAPASVGPLPSGYTFSLPVA